MEPTLTLVSENELLKPEIIRTVKTSYINTYHIYDIDGQTFYIYTNVIPSNKIWKLELHDDAIHSHEDVFDIFLDRLQSLSVFRMRLGFDGE